MLVGNTESSSDFLKVTILFRAFMSWRAAQPSAMHTAKNKEDPCKTLFKLFTLTTQGEPNAFQKVSLPVSNGINPPASSMDYHPGASLKWHMGLGT